MRKEPSRERKNEFTLAAGLFILAFLLRLAYFFFLKNHYFFVDHPSGDVMYYLDWAQRISQGDFWGQGVFMGLPLYPYFLAVVRGFTFGNIVLLHLFQLAMGAANCVLVYFLARKVFSLKVAALAGLLCAANFTLIYYSWLLMPVTLIIFLTLSILLILVHPERFTKPSEWFITGLLMGLAAVGDGKFLIFTVLLLLFQSFKNKSAPARWSKQWLPLVLGVFVMVFGVTLRNKAVGGDWVLISAQSGLSLYAGNNPAASGIYENPDFIRPTHGGQDEDQKLAAEQVLGKNLSRAQVSQFWRDQALAFIKKNPAAYLRLLGRKAALFLTDNEAANDIDLILQRDWKNRLDFNPYLIICPLALAGIFLARKKYPRAAYLTLVVIAQMAVTLIFFLTARHRASILPLLICFEAYSVIWLIESLRDRKFSAAAALMIFTAVCVSLFPPRPLDRGIVNFLIHAKTGPVLDLQGRFSDAQDHYRQALAFNPRDVNSLYNLGTSYLLSEDNVKAQETLIHALSLCPFNADVLFNLGIVYGNLGKPELAMESFHKVLEYQPGTLDAHFRLAQLYQDQGQCGPARQHIEAIVKENPLLKDELEKTFSRCP